MLTAVIIIKFYMIFYMEKHESVQRMSQQRLQKIHSKCETFIDSAVFVCFLLQEDTTVRNLAGNQS